MSQPARYGTEPEGEHATARQQNAERAWSSSKLCLRCRLQPRGRFRGKGCSVQEAAEGGRIPPGYWRLSRTAIKTTYTGTSNKASSFGMPIFAPLGFEYSADETFFFIPFTRAGTDLPESAFRDSGLADRLLLIPLISYSISERREPQEKRTFDAVAQISIQLSLSVNGCAQVAGSDATTVISRQLNPPSSAAGATR